MFRDVHHAGARLRQNQNGSSDTAIEEQGDSHARIADRG